MISPALGSFLANLASQQNAQGNNATIPDDYATRQAALGQASTVIGPAAGAMAGIQPSQQPNPYQLTPEQQQAQLIAQQNADSAAEAAHKAHLLSQMHPEVVDALGWLFGGSKPSSKSSKTSATPDMPNFQGPIDPNAGQTQAPSNPAMNQASIQGPVNPAMGQSPSNAQVTMPPMGTAGLQIGGANPFMGNPLGPTQQSAQPPLSDIASQVAKSQTATAPESPTYGMTPEQQQALQDQYKAVNDLMTQAQQKRLSAAQGPVPQMHQFGLAQAIPGLIGALLDKRGTFMPAFEQGLQGQNQIAFQNAQQQYQQQQNAANIEAGGLEEQAKTKLGQIAAQIGQQERLDELKEKTYAADTGVYGKLGVAGINSQSRQQIAQLNANAKQVAAATTNQWKDLTSQEKQLLTGIASDKTDPATRTAFIQALKAASPNIWGQMPDSVIQAASTQVPAGYRLQEANAQKAAQIADFFGAKTEDLDAWRNPQKQLLLNRAAQMATKGQLDQAHIEQIKQEVASYPAEAQATAALNATKIAIAQSQIAKAQQDYQNGLPGAPQNLVSAWGDQVKTYKSTVDSLNDAISKYMNQGKPPADGTPEKDEFDYLTRQRDIALNKAADLQGKVKAATLQIMQKPPAQPMIPPVTDEQPVIVAPNNSAASHGANPNLSGQIDTSSSPAKATTPFDSSLVQPTGPNATQISKLNASLRQAGLKHPEWTHDQRVAALNAYQQAVKRYQ